MNKRLTSPYYASKTLLGYMDTSVNKTQNHPCSPVVATLWNHLGLGHWAGDVLAGWQWAWASPLYLWPLVFSSWRRRNWTESPITWVSPRAPVLLTLSVPYINQSARFNVIYLKLPEMFSLTTNDTLSSFFRPLSKNHSLWVFPDYPICLQTYWCPWQPFNIQRQCCRGRWEERLTLLNEKREQVGKRQKRVAWLPGVTWLESVLWEGYCTQGSSVDRNERWSGSLWGQLQHFEMKYKYTWAFISCLLYARDWVKHFVPNISHVLPSSKLGIKCYHFPFREEDTQALKMKILWPRCQKLKKKSSFTKAYPLLLSCCRKVLATNSVAGSPLGQNLGHK